ncbi:MULTISPECIES: hypothetical protein [Bacillus cereus group]|uniref:hypothetical protein n=1 Tax=Bacillus cereus group TaxID=86661 RepID=UPI001F5BABA7|nr:MULTISPECIES: hypothetical protein [Bacillus cereus group]
MSINYFTEKPTVKKRQPHKRKTSKISKENSVERVFNRFIDTKVKQNLRPKSLSQFISVNINTNKILFYFVKFTTSLWVNN